MKKIPGVAALLLLFHLPSPAQAQSKRPIFLQGIEAPQKKLCKGKVTINMGGIDYNLTRLQDMDYTLPDGTLVTNKNPHHAFNDCSVTNIGEVTAFSTGPMKSGISVRAEIIPEGKKDSFVSTYAERKAAIQQNMTAQKFEFLEDGTIKTKFKTSIIYMLPKEMSKTGNGERAAIYCTLPSGVNIEQKEEIDKARHSCTTRYLHPNGLAFGYSFVDGTQDKHVLIDLTARKVLEKLVVKDVKETTTTP